MGVIPLSGAGFLKPISYPVAGGEPRIFTGSSPRWWWRSGDWCRHIDTLARDQPYWGHDCDSYLSCTMIKTVTFGLGVAAVQSLAPDIDPY